MEPWRSCGGAAVLDGPSCAGEAGAAGASVAPAGAELRVAALSVALRTVNCRSLKIGRSEEKRTSCKGNLLLENPAF